MSAYSRMWKRITAPPETRLGWWAVAFALASVVLNFAWMILPGGALLSFACGITGGVLALIAVLRKHEHGWVVFLSILPLFWVLMFILGEFLIPH